MLPKLTPEQREALQRSYGRAAVEDGQTHVIYYLVDSSRMSSIEQQEDAVAIREGIEEMEAGRVVSLEEADRRIRSELGFSPSE